MKQIKIIKIIVISIICMSIGINKVSATPINTNFVDDQLYQCVVDAYNTSNDTTYDVTHNLTDTELATIISLDCGYDFETSTNTDISNSVGIEKLVNLESLDLYIVESSASSFKTINLASNTKLKEVDLSGYPLTSIDLSKNVNLEKITLINNSLTSIDLSKNIKLKELSIAMNDLDSLDVSKNTALEYLDALENNLTSIDISKNILLRYLSLASNNLTKVDVSNNPLLYCISVSINNNLNSLDVSNNTKLKELEVGLTGIDTIDISNNPEVYVLIFSDLKELIISKDFDLYNLLHIGEDSIGIVSNSYLNETDTMVYSDLENIQISTADGKNVDLANLNNFIKNYSEKSLKLSATFDDDKTIDYSIILAENVGANATDDMVTTNPKTGLFNIVLIMCLALLSIGSCVFIYNKYKVEN